MLIVIDIQEYYIDEFRKQQKKFERMIVGITTRIRLAREREEQVVNLTRFEDGFTLPEVIELIKSCNRSHFLGKDKEDGSQSVHCLCKRLDIQPGEIELCGVFRDVCVLDTWKGLKRLGYTVTPVSYELTMATSTNWRGIEKYPNGYLEETEMKFNTEEDNANQMREIVGELPEENELVITPNGIVVLDEEGPIRAEDIGKPVGNPIICGC